MFLLKYVDRIALLCLLSVSLGVPAAAFACSAATAQSSHVSARLPLPGGGETRFYAAGPAGTTTCRVDLTAAGQVLGAAQVLTDDNFRDINAGMSADEVLARIGPPSTKMRFERTKTTSWDYHFTDAWSFDSEFSVIIDDRGLVVSKFTKRLGQ